MNYIWLGLLLTVAGGAMQGSFTVPQKYLKGWTWEMGWLIYSIAGLLIFPWLLVALTIPQPMAVYAHAGFRPVALAALFGAGWGVGSVFFGLGVAAVGTALGFAIIISLTAAAGSLVPMAVLHPDQVWSEKGALLGLGLLIVIVGVILCARAGALKEAALRARAKDEGAAPPRNFKRGLLICIASGLMSPMFNFALAFSDKISEEAARMGANPATVSIAKLTVAITAGFVINAGYCLYLMSASGWKKSPGNGLRNTVLASLMGFLWLFGMFFYGQGAMELGPLGSILGWPLFMTVVVLVANVWGLLTGEWKNAGRPAMRYLAAGNTVMIVALLVIGVATKY